MKNIIHKIKKPALPKIAAWLIMILIAGSLILSISSASAQTECDPSKQLCNPLRAKDFVALLKDILKVVMKIGIIVAVVAIIWAGYLFVSAGGSEEKISKAKTLFFWTIIGAAIIIGAEVIVTAVDNFFKGIR